LSGARKWSTNAERLLRFQRGRESVRVTQKGNEPCLAHRVVVPASWRRPRAPRGTQRESLAVRGLVLNNVYGLLFSDQLHYNYAFNPCPDNRPLAVNCHEIVRGC
jgi:hypothetical protein